MGSKKAIFLPFFSNLFANSLEKRKIIGYTVNVIIFFAHYFQRESLIFRRNITCKMTYVPKQWNA
jgi:hypothetical protein